MFPLKKNRLEIAILMGRAWHWQRETYISMTAIKLPMRNYRGIENDGQLNSSFTKAFVMDALNLLPNSGTASNYPREIERQASQDRRKMWC